MVDTHTHHHHLHLSAQFFIFSKPHHHCDQCHHFQQPTLISYKFHNSLSLSRSLIARSLMEGISVSLYKGLSGYWRRKHYERLDGSSGRRRRRLNRVKFLERFGSDKHEQTPGRGRRRRFWRIKITPKLQRIDNYSPRKLFKCLRDMYVKMMISFSKSRVFINGYGGGGMTSIGHGGLAGTKAAPASYDEKMVIEICKSLMSQGHLMAHHHEGAAAACLLEPTV